MIEDIAVKISSQNPILKKNNKSNIRDDAVKSDDDPKQSIQYPKRMSQNDLLKTRKH